MVAPPNLTLTVTPPGGSPVTYTTRLAWAGANQTPSISQNFGRQGDTALLPIVEDYSASGTPTLAILAQSQIELYDNTADTYLFTGVVNKPAQSVRANACLNEWDLGSTDYTAYADAADVHGIYYGWTADQIVIDLTRQANCGITAASVADGGYVAPGPQIGAYVLNWKSLSTAWRQLAVLAGSSTPYGWFVDQNLELHFFDASSAQSSGVTFTTSPTTGGSLTEGHIILDSQNSYTQDATALANRILVQGASQKFKYGTTTSPPTDVWMGNGAQSAWPLRYTVSGTPVLYVGGVKQTVTVATAGTTATGNWVVEQNSVGSYFLVAATAPNDGVSIKIWYDYQVPIVMQAQDSASQTQYSGPNHGVYSLFISDSSLTTPEMALARAQQTRTEYAFAAQTCSFNTSQDWIGWVRAGQTCVIDSLLLFDPQSETYGIDDTFIVTANSITFGDGGYRTMQITAVRA